VRYREAISIGHPLEMATGRATTIGATAEGLVTGRLERAGWHILGRNVRHGRHEIDILAIDPGPPARLVAVEVRYRSRRDFGLAEDTFDHRKRRRTLTALYGILTTGRLADGTRVPLLPPAVDLVVVEGRGDGLRVRHHRDAAA
jgi:Holliday junction resolvase-like predicted endonuclease